MSKTIRATALVILAFSACIMCDSACAEAEHRPVVWKMQKARFDYQGFTTRYSCDGLRDKIRQVLRDLGARKDFTVTASNCGNGGPVPFPSVDIALATIKRADGPASIDAIWKEVDLSGVGKLQGGDCELAEQIVQKILPLFEVRKAHMNAVCDPHQLPTGAFSLTLEVLSTISPS